MSYTELFGLTKNNTVSIGEARNAWRGARAVWISLEKKYLPKFVPDWVKILKADEGAFYSRTAATMTGNGPIQEIWDLVKSTQLTKAEKIVLASTFDKVLAKVEDIDQVLSAFREFDGETNLKEQADIIENAIKDNPEIIAIGWNQTSVNGDSWATENYCEESGESLGYNLETGTKHWFLIEGLEKDAS